MPLAGYANVRLARRCLFDLAVCSSGSSVVVVDPGEPDERGSSLR